MNTPSQRIGVAAMTESMLKHKWSAVILRHLNRALSDPADIAKIEPGISPKVMSDRLRTMLRYGLIARFPRPAPSSIIEYRLTALGKKILEMINNIDALDEQLKQGRFVCKKEYSEISDDTKVEVPEEEGSFVAARRSVDLSVRR